MRALTWMHYAFSTEYVAEIYEREALRAAVVREIERTGVGHRVLACEIGISTSTLRRVLTGRMPDGRVRRRLSDWSEHRLPEVPTAGTVLLTAAAELFPAGIRDDARRHLARYLAACYRDESRPVPPWVAEATSR